jgi:hypothetical protein
LKFTVQDMTDPGKALKWLVFHIALGAASSFVKYIFIAFFWTVAYVNLKAAFRDLKKGDAETFTLTMAYLLGNELINRIVQGSPFIPVEFSKYFCVFLWGYAAMIRKGAFHGLGLAMVIMALPGALYDQSDMVVWADIVNCYLAPLGLAIGIGFWGNTRPSSTLIAKTMHLIWLGCVAVLVCMYIRTPKFEDINFSLAATKQTTGGVSSNQAATILGLGMFLSFFSFYRKKNFAGRRIFDILAIMAFALQGLLTFSRGGVLVGILAIILLILSPSGEGDTAEQKEKARNQFVKNLGYLAMGAIFLVLAFFVVDGLTGGLLSLRYRGETEGTLSGTADKSLNKVTSGRSDVVEYDLQIWEKYPVFGGGAGSSMYLRLPMEGVLIAPHVELSRLLAEQGVFGLVFFILILFLGLMIWLRRKIVPDSDLLMALYFIGLTTSFHAAMRTFVTPFFIAISALALAVQPKHKGQT